jgi:hypothetical protein
MVAGARHVAAIAPAAAALAAISVHRICFGFLTLMTLLLYRNTFDAWGPLLPTGLAGVSQWVFAGAAGALLAAGTTPRVVRRIGKPRWTTLLLGLGVLQVGLWVPFLPPTAIAAGFVLGFVGQGVKICTDTTLQETVSDDHRGRVFSFYDTLFNVTFVVAVVAGAFLLPSSGISYAVLAGVAVTYLLATVWYAGQARRRFVGVTPTNPLRSGHEAR